MIRFKIKVDAKGMADRVTERLRKQTKPAVEAAQKRIVSLWAWHARRELNTSRDAYVAGIKPGPVTMRGTPPMPQASISLVGTWPNMLEDGFEAFDMKPGLLGGRTAKRPKIKEKARKPGITPIMRPTKAKPADDGIYVIVPVGRKKFRTVSNRSPHASWMHPGYKGVKLVERLKPKVHAILLEELRRRGI